MHCCICGDEKRLTAPVRYWAPDDGWRVGRFCRACQTYAQRQPKPADYAYQRRPEYLSDVDEAIDVIYG